MGKRNWHLWTKSNNFWNRRSHGLYYYYYSPYGLFLLQQRRRQGPPSVNIELSVATDHQVVLYWTTPTMSYPFFDGIAHANTTEGIWNVSLERNHNPSWCALGLWIRIKM